MAPKVTVLMSVYNGEAYLAAALESILRQTFTDFEFLIINDASTDGSAELIRSYPDERIVLVTNETNLGLTKSLNKGLQLARGEYLARMDADDISLPERLAAQVAYLDAHPDIVLLGTGRTRISPEGKVIASDEQFNGPAFLRALSLFGNITNHPSVMGRTAVFQQLQYDESLPAAQDYELWCRMVEVGDVDNLLQPLLKYRVHPASISQSKRQAQHDTVAKTHRRLLDKLGLSVSDDELNLHTALTHRPGTAILHHADLLRVADWLRTLRAANLQQGVYQPAALDRALSIVWTHHIVRRNTVTNILQLPFYLTATPGLSAGQRAKIALYSGYKLTR